MAAYRMASVARQAAASVAGPHALGGCPAFRGGPAACHRLADGRRAASGARAFGWLPRAWPSPGLRAGPLPSSCLLYTSDAADDM
eukprot:2715311-Alexandrium_andersonii.AAC.1